MPADDVFAKLDQAVLDSLITGRPLPGGAKVSLPDLGFLLREPAILVAAEGLAGTLSGASLPHPLRVLPRGELESVAPESDAAYMQFRNEIVSDDEVSVTLEGRLQPASSAKPLGLSSVRVIFRKRDGQWEAFGDPTISAA